MLTRLRLEGGHIQLSLAGVRYLPDESGAFEVPQEFVAELIRVHGGKVDPGVGALELQVEELEKDLAALKAHVNSKTQELTAARERLDAYKASLKPAQNQAVVNNGQRQPQPNTQQNNQGRK